MNYSKFNRLVSFMCLGTMLLSGAGLRAQEITITLNPGWTWISFPCTDTLDVETVFGSFVPLEGDVLESQYGITEYYGDFWFGTLQEIYPGCGYMYYSNSDDPVFLTFQTQQPLSPVTVMTLEPTDITTSNAIITSIVSVDSCNHIFVRGICWGTSPDPDIDGNHQDSENVADSLSISLDGLIPGTVYYVRAYVVTDCGLVYGDELSFATLDGSGSSGGHDYIDLGLPSGTLWATCNVGAETPESYGGYYAWGETETKDYYDWSTYQYCNGSEQTLTKYCYYSGYGYNGYTDNLTVLQSGDDAATVNWGAEWRMPTEEEWIELYENTTSTWTTRDGVAGLMFTASNNNSIFMPAAGYRIEGDQLFPGSSGGYWSSSLSLSNPEYARAFSFNSTGYYGTGGSFRRCGSSIRPVYAPQDIPSGVVNGKFSVSVNKQVYFSQGNLQYQASTDTWRFAENQYDFVGSDNANISEVYDGWIDLFGWGTSGWDNGNTYYHPWDWDNSNPALFGPPGKYNLTGEYANSDWGVYNPILNGGNEAGQWRTLSYTEWYYLLFSRNTVSGIRYVSANVNEVNGLILLPDDWNPEIYDLNTANGFDSNTLTDSQWSILEESGAVFLPTAGSRNATNVNSYGTLGFYWSASYFDESYADYMGFYGKAPQVYTTSKRHSGRSVRLVQDVTF